MANKPTIASVLTKIGKLPEPVKIPALRKVDSATQTILKYACDPNIKWLLPDGPLPEDIWTPSDLDDYAALYSEIRTFYLYVEGGKPDLKQLRREQLFIELLNNIAPDDAQLLILIKDKKLPEGLDAKLVKKAFPNLF